MKKLLVIVCVVMMAGILASAQVPSAGHVFVVVLENHGYTSVIGNSSMPYLNSLARRYGLATQYYANAHPSLTNYFVMTTGRTITFNDSFSSKVTADNIVRRLLISGKTWKAYAEGLPYAGYTGGDRTGYVKHHNPFAYFVDVVNSRSERLNMVPFSRFATDRRNNALPRYSFVIPNNCHNAHDCSLGTADAWLKKNFAPLLSTSSFQKDGLLIIVFDEANFGDRTHGGGRVAFVAVGPKVKSNYRSSTFFQHQSLLRTTMSALGMRNFIGASITAPSMKGFFK
ncbi:MAG TPA: alkaline phosphatase family protein [Clostridia bacterium]|nr:alkaline phosphatase family protein [Clostridia bacterium]